MVGITSLLTTIGVDFIKDLITDNGEDLVKEGIKKVTGIDLEKKTKITPEERKAIINAEVQIKKQIQKDRQNARANEENIQNSKAPFLVKINKTIISQTTLALCFLLFFFVLTNKFDLQNSNVSLIVGACIGYVSQILSYYFGSAENNKG